MNFFLLSLIFSLLFYKCGLAQIIPPYDKIGKEILFVDTLIAKKQTDIKIKELNGVLTAATLPLDKGAVAYYNLAICYAAKQEAKKTFFYLKNCLKAGPKFMTFILTDTDFELFRNDSWWTDITRTIDSTYLSYLPKIKEKKLSVELFHIYLNDQQGRGMGLKKKDEKFFHDPEDLKVVEAIINKYGWPTYSMVGPISANAAFLVIQHSSLQTQEKYYKMLSDAVDHNEASKESFALLTDRISVDKYGFQIYGTQVYKEKETDGKYGDYRYFPIKEEFKVDSLRKIMGLIPLKQYLALFKIDYHPNPKQNERE